MQLDIKTHFGQEIQPYLDRVTHLKPKELSELKQIQHRNFLEQCSKSKNAILVTVWDKGELVGISSAAPSRDLPVDIKNSLEKEKLNLNNIFYFGPSFLLPKYRGQGIGKHFFDTREEHALEIMENLEYTFFHTKERSNGLLDFWKKMKYQENSLQNLNFKINHTVWARRWL